MPAKRTFRQHLIGHLMRRLAVTHVAGEPSPEGSECTMHIYIVCHVAGGSIISPIEFFHTFEEAQDLQKKSYPWAVIARMTLGKDGFTKL